MENNAPKVILFGGTFDPPHAGHIECVYFAHRSFPEAKILIVPSYRPPATQSQEKAPEASFQERIAMCEVAFDTLLKKEPTKIFISTMEELLPPPSYTVHTLESFTRQHPQAGRPGWLMGADQIRNLPHWNSPQRILEIADLIVVGREQKQSLVDEVKVAIEALRLPQVLREENGDLVVGDACRIYCLDTKTTPAASHIVRRNFLRSEGLPPGWVPHDVLRYIEHKKIYAKGKP